MRIVTSSQMRDLDRRASEEYGVPSILLMENAGLRAFDVAFRMLSECGGNRAVIVCGRGNNGGDGFVVARHLDQAGVDVRVFVVGRIEEIKGDARVNLDIALKSGLDVEEVDDIARLRSAVAHSHLVVDALVGTGLKGEITGLPAQIIEEINAGGRLVLSLDIPSGVDADTGQILGAAVYADETITFGLPKIGLAQYPGAGCAGVVSTAEIGIPEAAIRTADIRTFVITEEDVLYRLPERPADGHKGIFGRVVIFAGSVGMTGAAAMAGEAALRVGAGLVKVGVPESLNDILEVKLTEVMTVPLPETGARSLSYSALSAALDAAVSSDAVAIGPGLGRHPDISKFVKELLYKLDKPIVVDADGLNAAAEDVSMFRDISADLVLTPHPGEMARLIGTDVESVQSNRVETARAAAERFGAVVVLKGAGTVIASPDGEVWISPIACPALASGGSGDVLTGMITGLIAQGLEPLDAAVCGVFLHGRAGEIAVESIGDAAIPASELPLIIPAAIASICGGEEDYL